MVQLVGNKIFHRVVREKLLEFRAKLGGEGFVVRQNQSRAVDFGDDVRHRERLAGAGHTEQRLLFQPVLDAVYQAFDRFRLVAGRLVVGYKFKMIHRPPPFPKIIYNQYTTTIFVLQDKE